MPPLIANGISGRLAAADVGTNAQKGAALETIVAETFCQFPGVGIIDSNISDDANTLEVDILLYNQQLPGGLPFLSELILIECKNWLHPVDTASVRAFVSKLDDAGLDFGLIVASNGITGTPDDLDAAHGYLRGEFLKRRRKVLVLTRAELEQLVSTEELFAMLSRKFGHFIMGRRAF